MMASLLFLLCFTCNALRLPQFERDNEWIMLATQIITNNLGRRTKQFRDDGMPLTLMFGNSAYREVIINQMVGFHALNITSYEIVCLDQQLVDFMVSIGKPCIGDLIGGGLDSIWQARLHIIDTLLANGTSVLLTDADAVWIKNPMEFIRDADIVTQRGSFPFGIGKQLGATACMGFAYFAGNPAVSNFFHEEIITKFEHVHDDQRALNEAMMDDGIYFDHKLDYQQSRNIDRGIIPAKVHRRELHVNFLDHYRFPRVCRAGTVQADTIVAHCLSPKNGLGKIAELKKNGLHRLKDDWESVRGNEDFEEYIGDVISISSVRAVQTRQGMENLRLGKDEAVYIEEDFMGRNSSWWE